MKLSNKNNNDEDDGMEIALSVSRENAHTFTFANNTQDYGPSLHELLQQSPSRVAPYSHRTRSRATLHVLKASITIHGSVCSNVTLSTLAMGLFVTTKFRTPARTMCLA